MIVLNFSFFVPFKSYFAMIFLFFIMKCARAEKIGQAAGRQTQASLAFAFFLGLLLLLTLFTTQRNIFREDNSRLSLPLLLISVVCVSERTYTLTTVFVLYYYKNASLL